MTIYDTSLDIPAGVEAKIEGQLVKIKGPKGQVEKKLHHPTVAILVEGKHILIKSRLSKPNKNNKMQINTFRAHLQNIINGVQKPYKATLKVCSGHFPITVIVEANNLVVKNFLGEKSPRKAAIIPGIKVTAQGDQIIVEGADIDGVSQTAARIEQSTRITNRDRRIFQDGCYITSKPGEEE